MTRVALFSLGVSILLLLVVLELVRRRRLMERYSLLWIVTGLTLVVFAAWPAALARLSTAAGIAYPPTALFVVAVGFILVVLLHFSTVISRLVERNQRLAQHVGLIEERLERMEHQRSAVPGDAVLDDASTPPVAVGPRRA